MFRKYQYTWKFGDKKGKASAYFWNISILLHWLTEWSHSGWKYYLETDDILANENSPLVKLPYLHIGWHGIQRHDFDFNNDYPKLYSL